MTPITRFRLAAAAGLGLALVLWAALGLAAVAQGPLGTSFAFQGRLRLSGGAYVTQQACDFRASLWNAPAGSPAGQLGPTLDRLDVPVQDGYFTLELDFGPVFNGDQRFLEIGVRCPANGGAGPYSLLGERANLNAIPYAQYAPAYGSGSAAWDRINGLPPGFADNIDNVLTYTAGYGLAQAGNQFSLLPQVLVNDGALQRRVLDGCPPGQTIQTVGANGSVTCRDGDVTYSAGLGLRLDRVDPNGNPILEPNLDVVQQRVASLLCTGASPDRAIRGISATGGVLCEVIPGGDIEEIVGGPGIAVENGEGPGVVTMTVATAGIATDMLADNAVVTAKLADGAAGSANLAANAVTGADIANGSLTLADLNQNGCDNGQMMQATTVASQTVWACADDATQNLIAGDGIAINGSAISVRLPSPRQGITVDAASQEIVADFPPANSAVFNSSNVQTGLSGAANTAARSDHSHDTVYPLRNDPAAGDLDGNYVDGFTVDRLNGIDLLGPFTGANNIFLYNGTSWQASSPNLPLDIQIVSGSIQDNGSVSCPANHQVIGGGCDCTDATGGDDKIEDAYPSSGNAFFCNCSDNQQFTAFAMCVRTAYGNAQ